MDKPDLSDYMTACEITRRAMVDLNIHKPRSELTNRDIRRIIRWVGFCSMDIAFIDGDKPVLGRISIGLMLSVTLMEFPEYYMKYELSQYN